MKLILVLDDVQRWLGYDAKILQKLSSIIAYTTNLHAISWLITVEDRCIDTVVSDCKEFWEKYSFAPSINRQIHEAELRSRLHKTQDHDMIDYHVSNISGWIDLDQLNIHSQTGILLIQENLRNRNDQISLQWMEDHTNWISGLLDKDEPGKNKLLRYWSNPFIACIILEVCLDKEIPIQNLIDLSFTDFVSLYWRKRLDSLDLTPLAQKCTSATSSESVLVAKDILNTATHLIAKSFAERGFTLSERDIVRYIQGIADDRPDLFHYLPKDLLPLVIAQCINLLVMGGILKESALLDKSFNVRIRMIGILFEPFWMWRLAEELRSSNFITDQIEVNASQALESFLSRIQSEELREAVIEFFLLMLQDKQDVANLEDTFAIYLWSLGFKSSFFPLHCVWFAASRVDSNIQTLVANLTKEYSSTFSFSSDRHRLFAFMYFIRQSLPTSLSATARLEHFKPYYHAIASNGMSDYYLYTFQQIMLYVQDEETLLETMKLLAGSEMLGITPALAWISIESMKNILGNDMSRIYDFLISYLQQSGKAAIAEYKAKSSHKWVRTYFREWVLCYFCRFLAESKTPNEAYVFLDTHSWYEAQRFSIDLSIAKEMDREANIALGYGYHGAEEQDRELFVNLINHLVESRKPKSIEIAFFLIRHTKPTRGQVAVLLDPEFQPFLRRIFMNIHPITNHIAEKYSDMFKANLGDYNELVLKREKLRAKLRKRKRWQRHEL